MPDKPRWAKSDQERIDDTLAYIKSKLELVDYNEVNSKVNTMNDSQKKALSSAISIGSSGTKSSERETNRENRRAKRAVLMATKLFLKNDVYLNQELTRVKALPETSDAQLLRELKSWFILPNATPESVADKAVEVIDQMPNWHNINIEPSQAVRGQISKQMKFNCYNAVIFWAFQGGAISRRFLWNKLHGKNGNEFFPIFEKCGWNTPIHYDINIKPFKEFAHEYKNQDSWDVPKGQTVYFVTPYKKFGHVALSLGEGKIISQNAVLPANQSAIKPEDRDAVRKMNIAETHMLGIKNFWDIHYHPDNGYHKLQYTKKAFWLAYEASER